MDRCFWISDWAIGFQQELVPFCCTVQSACYRMDRCFLVCHLHSSVSLLQNGLMLLDQWLSYRIFSRKWCLSAAQFNQFAVEWIDAFWSVICIAQSACYRMDRCFWISDWAIGFQLEMVPVSCTVQSVYCRMDRCSLACHLHSSVSLLQNGSMLLDQWLSLLQNGSMLFGLLSA